MELALSEDRRQRVADQLAVMVLTRALMMQVELDLARLAPMVANACDAESPENLQAYSSMGWNKAIREIKIGFVNYYLASHPPGPDGLPPAAVDQQIGACLLSAFFKFVTIRSMDPDWYAAHLDKVRLPEPPATGA